MSFFSSPSDVSGTIKLEGEKIAVSFKQGLPESGQGTVVWNIPSPIAGCETMSAPNSAYCGIVITLSETASTYAQAPKDGVRYTADPTADPELHAGDNIAGACVIGAFYEGEKKGAGLELTTSFVVTDVDPDKFYYVTAYAVDCQGRHHTDGMRAYAADLGDIEEPASPAKSSVTLNDGKGAKPTDGTNLTPGVEYGFEFDLNTSFPDDSPESNRIVVKFDGEDAQTYGDMVDTINDQLADTDNPFRSTVPPNAGSLQWDDDSKTLKEFNGNLYATVPDVIVSDGTDPTALVDGDDYWFDLDGMQFKVRNSANLVNDGWDDFTTIIHPTDPSQPECDEVWFNGTEARKWSGTVWCELQLFSQDNDPSLRAEGICGQFWYNSDIKSLFGYDVDNQTWVEKFAINLPIAPNTIPAGFFWFDETVGVIRERKIVGSSFEWVPRLETDSAIGEVTPANPTVDYVWYKPSIDQIHVYNGTKFVALEPDAYVSWPTDPSDVSSCSLWWNDYVDPDELKEWDSLSNAWVLVAQFDNTNVDPLDPPEIKEDSIWNDTSTNTLKLWDGACYSDEFSYIDYPTDPTKLDPADADAPNTAWFDTTEKQWKIFTTGGSLPAAWTEVDAIVRNDDPAKPVAGQYWFDDENDILYQRTSTDTWKPEAFTTKPISNAVGTLWFDINDKTLKEWNGKNWVPAKSKVSAGLDNKGNLVFETREGGSCVSLLMLVPGVNQQTENDPNVTTSGVKHAGGYMRTYTDNPFELPQYLNTSLPDDVFLFDAIEDASVQPAQVGHDGLQSQPAYAQIGVGTDGSADERRELSHSIRVQLGHPVVEVELTEEQLQTCITGAFESLRKRSDIAYRREFYMFDTRPGIQKYSMTNRKANFHKIVGIHGAHRRSGVFGGGYSSNSVFDQLFTNQLYQNTTHGGFDLTSLHLSQQYLEQIELMFATRLTFHFSEHDRMLNLHQAMHKQERILLDTTIDRTEQDMLKDRFVKSWIERHAMASARLNLSEIRGKYGTLPGAGGGVSLNASDLAAQAREDFADCSAQLENYIAAQNEMYGAWDCVIG